MKKAAHIFATGINQTALNHSFIKRPPTDTTVGRQVRALKQRYNFLRPYIFGYIGRQFSTIVAHNIFIRACPPENDRTFLCGQIRLSEVHRPEMLGLRSVFSGKAAREFFRCGAIIFHFPNQNEKVPAPRFSERGNRKLWCANPSFSLNTVAHEMMRLHAK